MLGYLIRRLLLFVPTLLGATFIIFMLMAASKVSIVDVLLPPNGEMKPGARAQREEYIEERYGLDKPTVVQYLKWLNNVSPVGFHVWRRDDPQVKPAVAARREWRAKAEAGIRAKSPGMSENDVTKARKKLEKNQDFKPLPGDLRFDKSPFKVPDLGSSFIQARPVSDIIVEALPVTILLQLFSLPISIGIALMTGVWAARFRGGWQDWGIGTILLMLSALPVIWVGVTLIGFFANVQYVDWFPAAGLHGVTADSMRFFPGRGPAGEVESGYFFDTMWHVALPVICISYGTFAYYSKLTRTSLLEALSADYVRTARAKGLPARTVLWRHAFRNSLIPLITVAAAFLPLLVTGSIVVETIFGINGMGRLAITSLYTNDRELFLSISLLTMVLQLVSFLLADIAYVLADPRVSYDA